MRAKTADDPSKPRSELRFAHISFCTLAHHEFGIMMLRKSTAYDSCNFDKTLVREIGPKSSTYKKQSINFGSHIHYSIYVYVGH